jgi:hypothetical protein
MDIIYYIFSLIDLDTVANFDVVVKMPLIFIIKKA